MSAPRSFLSDEPIERGLPTNGAKNQFLRQPAIDLCERGFRERFVEQILDEAAAVSMAAEDAGGNFSWFFRTHCLIMSFAQLEATTSAFPRGSFWTSARYERRV